jgi:radical SAM protein with 4Fe4S-binding SPASM domain
MLELTWRCNFRCVHCYQEGLRDRHDELTAEEWKRLIDELADLGCVFLTLTGGETLLRRDFGEIYTHAIKRGFVVTVFTNGSLVDDEVIELWSRLETYQRVTGNAGGFSRAMAAIDRILALGIRLELKAPAMKPLVAELPAMAEFASSRGVSFRYDAGLFPRLDGNRAPLEYRLSPAETLALESKAPGFATLLDACFAEVPAFEDRVYRCGAGSNAFNVDPSGHIEACAISRGTSLDWREIGAGGAWEGLAGEASRAHRFADGKGQRFPGSDTMGSCGNCSARGGCGRCPGKSWLETGDVEKPVAHYCDITVSKLKLLKKAS